MGHRMEAEESAEVRAGTQTEQGESMGTMVEAAGARCHGSLSGLSALSRDVLHLLQQPVHSLDGRDVLS